MTAAAAVDVRLERAQTHTEHPMCAVHACRTPVDSWGEVCSDCEAIFGPYLSRSERSAGNTPEQIAAALAERDRETVRAYTELAAIELAEPQGDRKERRRNQTCWICEERHTCTREERGWECSRCVEVRG
ncbi:hypothetical protein [Mycolicibacterium llatzerense]|uniref:hypothetical protein n=1 Tax=Mycolicibacterium llatzerense TaxID=280871 RepID=UPI0008DE0AF3|nr:hypothetical protein [Mycolicibacterium llatzerense]